MTSAEIARSGEGAGDRRRLEIRGRSPFTRSDPPPCLPINRGREADLDRRVLATFSGRSGAASGAAAQPARRPVRTTSMCTQAAAFRFRCMSSRSVWPLTHTMASPLCRHLPPRGRSSLATSALYSAARPPSSTSWMTSRSTPTYRIHDMYICMCIYIYIYIYTHDT